MSELLKEYIHKEDIFSLFIYLYTINGKCTTIIYEYNTSHTIHYDTQFLMNSCSFSPTKFCPTGAYIFPDRK